MEYIQLGNSDLQISRISFGCMSLKAGQEDFESIIRKAVEAGIYYFDTADLYEHGKNEEELGKAIRGMRKKLVIATKAGNQWKEDGSGWTWNPAKDYILKCAEDSLKRLKTDYIDLFQLHGGTLEDPYEETIEAFELLKKQGKIRYYGISSIRPNVIRRFVEHSNIISVMLQYNILDRRPEEAVLDLLQTSGKGVLVRGAVAGGLLVDKPAKEYLEFSKEEVARVSETVRDMNKSRSGSPAETAIRFVLDHPAVSSAVVGIRTLEQLEEAVSVMGKSPLNNEETNRLKEAGKQIYYREHR